MSLITTPFFYEKKYFRFKTNVIYPHYSIFPTIKRYQDLSKVFLIDHTKIFPQFYAALNISRRMVLGHSYFIINTFIFSQRYLFFLAIHFNSSDTIIDGRQLGLDYIFDMKF